MAANDPAKNPGGAPVPGAWGQEQKKGMEKQRSQKQQSQESTSAPQQGDNRTPDEPIGEVAYANRDPANKNTGEF